jgi:uncharacterized protein (TIGR03790 family)
MDRRAAVLLAAIALFPSPLAAQTADNLLLVVNDNSPESQQVAAHYAAVRSVPARNIVHIQTSSGDAIGRLDFITQIEDPIALWIARHKLQDQVLYVVLTKGVPLRINGTGGLTGTVSSVDSELTLLYRKLVGIQVAAPGRIDNSFFLGERPIENARRFSRLTSDLYLVTRLDGFTVEDVKNLIDRSARPAKDGQIILDQRATMVDRGGDAWLAQTAERLTAMNHGSRVQLETTRAVAAAAGPVLGYFSWGSNDPSNRRRQMGLQFADGAIGGMFVSTDGRTFREPGTAWIPAPAGAATGGQSLAGDLIREGISGVSGHVAEPYLDAIIRPQILFPAYVSGFNLAEAFYLAMPFLSWQDIVIGDPLCAPFAEGRMPDTQIHKGLDEETDLPALFAERRLGILESSRLRIDALKLHLKAQSWLAQDRPVAEIHALWVRATALEPRLTFAQMQLAQAAEARNDDEDAIRRYRAIVAVEPDNVAALNNLAYVLADRRNGAKEALPLAERAYRLSGQSAAVADTLGWIHYKLGDAPTAIRYVDRAARLAPTSLEILIHAGMVHAGAKSLSQARTYLQAALKLDPKAADRDDVKALAARIR